MLLERMVCGTTAEEAEEGEKAVDHYRIIPTVDFYFYSEL